MDPLSRTFAALADPTRRAILARLADGDARVGDLGQPFSISGPAISRHLRVLEGAGLIRREVDAQWRLCRLQPLALQPVQDWLQRYAEHWEQSLDRLTEQLESAPAATPNTPPDNPSTPSTPHRSKPR